VLASLLPGLREIRAPLAAGYLWLVVAWLVFQDRVETGAAASGSVDALLTLKDELGTGGLTAAATFVAYLVGALWQPVAERVAELLWYWPRREHDIPPEEFGLATADFSENISIGRTEGESSKGRTPGSRRPTSE
jgi:hypothetical protein